MALQSLHPSLVTEASRLTDITSHTWHRPSVALARLHGGPGGTDALRLLSGCCMKLLIDKDWGKRLRCRWVTRRRTSATSSPFWASWTAPSPCAPPGAAPRRLHAQCVPLPLIRRDFEIIDHFNLTPHCAPGDGPLRSTALSSQQSMSSRHPAATACLLCDGAASGFFEDALRFEQAVLVGAAAGVSPRQW